MRVKSVIIAFAFLALFLVPMISADLGEDFDAIDSYVDSYDRGELNAPQLIVYVEYEVNQIYRNSDREIKGGFSEEEIQKYFEKTEAKPWEGRSSQYEKTVSTKDFNIVFTAHQYYRYDRDYWESRDERVRNYYTIGYHLSPLGFDTEEDLSSEIRDLVPDLEYLSEHEDKDRFEDTKKRLSKIQQKFWNVQDCNEIMNQLDFDKRESDDPYTKETIYHKTIKEVNDKNCWDNTQCENVCETVTVCDNNTSQNCHDEQVCEPDTCVDVVVNETTGETKQECTPGACTTKQVCDNTGGNCYDTTECHDDCTPSEQCDEFSNGELGIEVRCLDEGSNIYVTAWGEGLDPLNHLNDGGSWTCDSEIEELVGLRQILQKDLNNDFAAWFFEDFLSGDDYEKIINGEHGFRTVLNFVTSNEQEIADRLNCAENKEWPQGFDRIDINYTNSNTRVEVWEKFVPVEWSEVEFYTTLYKYSWIPDKELLKGMINYQISESGDFGPSPKEVAAIRNDEGQMEIINSLSERYGGSFDVRLRLNEGENSIVNKYLTINPNVTIGVFDSSYDGETDISLDVDYDSLYNFVKFVSYQSGGREINGPGWVRVEGDGGPGQFFSTIGALSKFWREGVDIKPRYALIKLFFSTGDIISLISSNGGDHNGNSVQLNEEELQKR